MKMSYRPVLVRDDMGMPYAIFAPADFTAEHEQELSELYCLIGAEPKSYRGIASYSLQANRVSAAERAMVVFQQAYSWTPDSDGTGKAPRKKRERALCMRLSRDGGEQRTYWSHWRPSAAAELSVAYSAAGFEVMAYSDAAKTFLVDLQAAISACDFACFRGGGSSNPFDRGGLVIAVPSRVPEDRKAVLRDAHAERKRLLDAAAATGIEERIRNRNGEPHANWRQALESEYRFHALGPAWTSTIADRGPDRGGIVNTKYDVVFFLNPASRNAEAGWYTIEELDEWIEGRGPVLKSTEKVEMPHT